MKINGQKIEAKEFAYDGCHKIYLINNDCDRIEAEQANYKILPISELEETWNNSCELRFISNWDLVGKVVDQFEEANFEE